MVNGQQTVVAGEAVPISVDPGQTVRVIATTDKQPRTVGCSLRCTVVIFFIIVAMLLCVYLTVAVLALLNDGISEEIDRFKEENERLEGINDEFTRNNEELDGLITEVEVEVNRLDDEVNSTQIENARLKASLNNFETLQVSLSSQLDDLKQVNDVLAQDSDKYSEQLGELRDLSIDLNDTIIRIEVQLDEYSDLREEIERSIDGTSGQVADVVQGINDAFNRVKQLSTTNLMLNIYNRVSSTEKLEDGEAGFTEIEFQRLLAQSAPTLNVTGDLPQNYLTFPEGETVISTFQVLTMIQEYVVNSTSDDVLAANLDKEVQSTD